MSTPLGWSVLTWGHVMLRTFLPSASLLQSKFSLVKVTTSMLISELYSCQSSMISSGPVGFSHLYDLDASFSATDHPCYGLPGGKKSLGIYVVASDPIDCGCKDFFRTFAWSPPTSSIRFFLGFLVGQPPPSSYWFKFGFKVAVKNHGFPIPQKDFKSLARGAPFLSGLE